MTEKLFDQICASDTRRIEPDPQSELVILMRQKQEDREDPKSWDIVEILRLRNYYGMSFLDRAGYVTTLESVIRRQMKQSGATDFGFINAEESRATAGEGMANSVVVRVLRSQGSFEKIPLIDAHFVNGRINIVP